MDNEIEKLYAQVAKLKNTVTKQTKEISILVKEYNTMRTMCGILTGIVIIESVLLMTKLS